MNNKDINVTITSGTFFKIALVMGLFALLYILRDVVLVLLTAVVIASAIEPATLWFVRHKIPRVLAVIFIYVFASSLILGILYVFVPPLLAEVSGFLLSLPEYTQTLTSGVEGGASGTQTFVEGLASEFSVRDAIIDAQNVLSNISSNLFQTVNIIFGGLFSFTLILVFSFYLAVRDRGIEEFLAIITPVKHEKYINSLWRRSQAKIGRWMQGQLLLGLIVGVLVYLGLTVLGVKYALLLAVFAALFELIPLFGPILAAIPAVLIAFLDSFSLGFMVLGLYTIIQQFENHLIYPLVVRKVVGVSPIVVILSLIIGAKLAGFLGLVLAVPIAAAIMEFIDDIEKEKKVELEKLNLPVGR